MTKVGRGYITLVNNAAPAVPAVTPEGNIALTDGFVVPAEDLVSSVYIAPAVGVAANRDITIGGTFAVGDVVKVTIISNAVSRQQWRKTYTHTVEVGFTALNDIAAAINALIDADGEQLDCPYTSAVVGPVVTVTSKNDDTSSLEIESYTTSAAGTAVVSGKTFTASEGQPDDLRDKGADESLVTAADYDTVRIVYKPTVAQPFIDMEGKKSIEIFWFGANAGTAAGGSALDTLINS